MNQEEINLIEIINKDLKPILDKYGIDKLKFAAQWLFVKKISKRFLVLTDTKGWKQTIEFDGNTAPSIYRVKSNTQLPTSHFDYGTGLIAKYIEFKMKTRSSSRRDCGCLDEYIYYEQDLNDEG
jgi:hypothetical protein